jgi:hypothetical protein
MQFACLEAAGVRAIVVTRRSLSIRLLPVDQKKKAKGKRLKRPEKPPRVGNPPFFGDTWHNLRRSTTRGTVDHGAPSTGLCQADE